MAKFIYVRQPKPLGDGHAILCAKEVIGNEPFAVLFGDDLVDSQVPALKQLIDIYEKKHAPVIALEKIDKKDSKKYGIIEPEKSEGRLHRIKSLVEKPASNEAPSNLAIIGKYILTPEVLEALERVQSGKDGEIRLINAFQLLTGKMPLYGYEIEGKRYDTGDKLGFCRLPLILRLNVRISTAFEKYMKDLFCKPKK